MTFVNVSGLLVVLIAIGAAACTRADTAADRKAVEALIAEFNSAIKVNDFERLARLFTKDADYADDHQPSKPAATAIREIVPKRLPWDERTALTMKIDRLEFPSRGHASVDATQSDFAPNLGISRKWSCHFVLVEDGGAWKIASYRESLLPDSTPASQPAAPANPKR